MRTSTLLVVLAALALLVACVSADSSSSSTGVVSSSSSTPSTVSSSTGSPVIPAPDSNSNSTTVVSSSSGPSSTPFIPNILPTLNVTISFPRDIITGNATTDASAIATFASTVAADVKSSIQKFYSANFGSSSVFSGVVTVPKVVAGSTIATVQVTQAPAQSTTDLANILATNRVGSLSDATIQGSTISDAAASSITIGFAAIAVVLAALLQ